MSGPATVALAVHDGFYGCGTGAGYANYGFLDTLLSLLPTGVHLAILPIRLAPGGPEHHPDWHARVRELVHGRDVSIHPIDNGTGGRDRWGGLDSFRECSIRTAECLAREVFSRSGPVLTIAFDVPFFGLGALLPAELRRHLIIVPRSSGWIHDPHDTERIAWERETLRAGSSKGARIGVISGYMRQHLRKDYGIPDHALLEFADGLCADDWRRLTESSGGDIAMPAEFMLSMGRAEPYKGFEDLLDAIAILRQRRCAVPHLVFAATTETSRPTAYQRHLAERITRLGIDARMLYGFSPAVSRILTYPGIRAVIVPSRAEPFGRIPMEAFAAGAGPVVTTTAHGLSGQIVDTVTGFTCAPADPGDLADALSRALTMTPAERLIMLDRARTYARRRYDHTAVVRRVLAETAPWLVLAA